MKNIFKIIALNIPNILSISRLLLLPLLFYFVLNKQIFNFGAFLIVFSLTDALDGYIARTFGLTSDLGAKLDSLADDLGIALITVLVLLVFPQIIERYLFPLLITCVLFVTVILLMRFRLHNIGLHFYSSKISQTYFLLMIIYMSFFGFNDLIYIPSIFLSSLAFIEQILTILIFKPNSDTASILEFTRTKRR